MVPIRAVFKNRWWTLAWAAGILWTAVSFAGSHGGANAGNGADDNDVEASAAAAVAEI